MARNNQAMQDLLAYNAAILPQKRSSFSKSHSHTTTMDSAWLVPLMWDRVNPGDEKKIRYSGLARMATPLHPVMDEANLDVWAFYIPDRLWWSHAKEFYGENLDASFNDDGLYIMPYLGPDKYYVNAETTAPDDPMGVGGLSDYLGMPVTNDRGTAFESYISENNGNGELLVSAGLHRSYQLIWNEWFRNTSIQPALRLSTGDTVTSDEWEVIRELRKVNKYPDYFTTLLREPQAGGDVYLPLGEWAPVVARNEDVDSELVIRNAALKVGDMVGQPFGPAFLVTDSDGTVGDGGDFADSFGVGARPLNLWADLTSASRATINNLRAAITIQQLLEIDAMGGKFYQSILKAHWGTFTPDATLSRTELLGATRATVGMRQVLQTSSTDEVSPQGNTAAFSVTNISNEWICNKAFTEPGFIMVLGAVRPVHSYSQGIDPLLQKLRRYDHYYPVFDNLGNQPVYAREAFASFNSELSSPEQYPNSVLGYKEAWTEYRIRQNRVSGKMRPDVSGTLASWNYSSNFGYTPVLNSAFIEEDPDLMDRTIAVSDEPQFIVDSYFDYVDIKNMGVHSVPGLTRL